MTIQENFKQASSGKHNYNINRLSDNPFVLQVIYSCNSVTRMMTYDFLARVMIASSGTAEGGVTVTPFSQLDAESLAFFRDELVKKQGLPPELPEVNDPLAAPFAAKKRLTR